MKEYYLGIDIGSTTIKVIVMDSKKKINFKKYLRHYSKIKETLINVFSEIELILKDKYVSVSITGSGGISFAEKLGINFVQEVVAEIKAIEFKNEETDVAIELGGEDAKIIYFGNNIENRMNGICAGGTGAFIDQMSLLLKTDAEGLNELAKKYRRIYPIASRCGVFAKTDVQVLLNEGASKEDIAVSIFQAVVNQTIAGLAQGKKIKGKILFLGGPLSFLSELKNRFIDVLNLSESDVIGGEYTQYYVAIGACLDSFNNPMVKFNKLHQNLLEIKKLTEKSVNFIKPLFETVEEYKEFKDRHSKETVEKIEINEYSGEAYLGIDAGSTTTKIVLITDEKKLLYSYYGSNNGKPLETIKNELIKIYNKFGERLKIKFSAVTGYGEQLIKDALKIDEGEVETIAHYKAASYFMPDVDFIIDIGGQDMKSFKVKNGVIDSIMLNEACSSGCGSFIETFSNSLNIDIDNFSEMGLNGKTPVDLGTKCTVFMNSKVKQVQKEGATIEDISAGLSISVIKNALYKVIKLKSIEELGNNIVVQGGTFYNDSVLRAFEKEIGKNVIRPDIAGLMGAFGAALIAKERCNGESIILKKSELENFTYKTSTTRCESCTNNCTLTINKFNDGRVFLSGNKCEKGLGIKTNKKEVPNMYIYKNKRLFEHYSPQKNSKRGKIGIPRVLNMYENYPFWYTLLSELGFEVVLSSKTTKNIYEMGIDSIPSESICYPAKLVHGHIIDLVKNKKIKSIFYPCMTYNLKNENKQSKYNCPVVASYPEVIDINIEELKDINFINPYLSLTNSKYLIKKLLESFSEYQISLKEIKRAVKSAYAELENYKNDIIIKSNEAIEFAKKNNFETVILAGRPYHVDGEINHGIPELLQSYNIVVLSEDSVMHLIEPEEKLKIVDQWGYHSRLYRAAEYAAKTDKTNLIQLTSFGCGLDSVTTDEVKRIIEKYGKIYSLLKIDETNNLGAVKIRIRSLLTAVKDKKSKINIKKEEFERVVFTKEMKENYKILIPQMSPYHFKFIEIAFNLSGFDVEVLENMNKDLVEYGLKYVHNDACYPAIITIGQIISALKSGKYDLNKVAIMMSQTGGGCRATNYISFLRKALKDLHMEYIPVISFNITGIEKNPGFKLNYLFLKNLIHGSIYADLLQRVVHKIRPYEKQTGETEKLYDIWMGKLKKSLSLGETQKKMRKNIELIISDFEKIQTNNIVKPKVGIVGEILVKYHPFANNNVVKILEEEGAEVIVSDIFDFALYTLNSAVVKHDSFGESLKSKWISKFIIKYLENYRKILIERLIKSEKLDISLRLKKMRELIEGYVSVENIMGEGWLLTAEMLELIENGIDNILCIQPFGCLPNHISGKGVIKRIKERNPYANIVPIDYDPGASEVNQVNRIKLMISNAHKNLKIKTNEIKNEKTIFENFKINEKIQN